MKKGFTLVEVIMLVVVVGIVAAIGVPLLLETVNAWSFTSRFQDNAVSQSIVAMSRMSREIRRLKNDASVATATQAQLSFTDLTNTTITFDQSGDLLRRNTDSLADIDNSNPLDFTYYNDTGAVIATPLVSPNNTNIRLITVSFSVLAGSNKLNFQLQARPQNLRRLNEKFK
jgi:prepilin-type N-terminal cleavage/methylation domain-containing protein